MTLEEFYEQMGVEYREVISRFLNHDQIVLKYLRKFLQDDTYNRLEEAMAEADGEAIFRYAHTLKGLSSNLSLMGILKYSSEIVAAIRKEWKRRGLWFWLWMTMN